MQRARGAGQHVVDQRGVVVEEPGDARHIALADGLRELRVAATGIKRPGDRVVLLVLLADDDGARLVALDAAAVNARPDGVGLGVQALGDREPRRAGLVVHRQQQRARAERQADEALGHAHGWECSLLSLYQLCARHGCCTSYARDTAESCCFTSCHTCANRCTRCRGARRCSAVVKNDQKVS